MSAEATTKQYLTPQELSDRYSNRITVRTLNNWRSSGGGPPFTKIGGGVLYPIDRLVEWEQKRTVHSTSQYKRG